MKSPSPATSHDAVVPTRSVPAADESRHSSRIEEKPSGPVAPSQKRRRPRWDQRPERQAAQLSPEDMALLLEVKSEQGKEVIFALTKSAGLDAVVAAVRPHMDDTDQLVRDSTSAALALLASVSGIPALLPSLEGACRSAGSWQARHAGMRAVEQIAVVMGREDALAPHLNCLVALLAHGLQDGELRVRRMAALSVPALAKAAPSSHRGGGAGAAFDIFEPMLKPLWRGVIHYHGKMLAAFATGLCAIIPFMDHKSASYFAGEVLFNVPRLLDSPDGETKGVALRIIVQCCRGTQGREVADPLRWMVPLFFKTFWARRAEHDPRNYEQLLGVTVEMTNRIGLHSIMETIAEQLEGDGEPYIQMVIETTEKAISGALDSGPDAGSFWLQGVLDDMDHLFSSSNSF